MWCGSRPTDQSASWPQPFSIPDADTERAVKSVPPTQEPDAAHWGKMMRLTPARNPLVQAVPMDGEMILFDLRTGRLHRLNSLGTAIWEQCTGSATLHEIHRAVCAQTGLSTDRAHDGVLSFISQWSHEGLLSSNTV